MFNTAGLLALGWAHAVGKFSLKLATNVAPALSCPLDCLASAASWPGTGDTTFFGDGFGGGGPRLNPLPVPECCPFGRDLGATLVLTLTVTGADDAWPTIW